MYSIFMKHAWHTPMRIIHFIPDFTDVHIQITIHTNEHTLYIIAERERKKKKKIIIIIKQTKKINRT